MRFVLLFLLCSLLGAALVFYFSGQNPVEENVIAQLIEKVEKQKKIKLAPPIEKKAKEIFKEISMLEDELEIKEKEVEKEQPVENLKTAKIVVNTPKQVESPRLKYKMQEDSRKLIQTGLGEFYIQENLKAVNPNKYQENQGAIIAQGQGLYFVSSSSPSDRFPLVVKKRGRSGLALLTGLITIKTTDKSVPARLINRYNLTEVQSFSHLNLYIFKTSKVENLASTYNSIKRESGVDSAELEVLDKRVRSL